MQLSSMNVRPIGRLRSISVLAVLALAASSAHAQGSGNGFLFGEPDAQFTLRAGYPRSNASSDLFTETRRDFTLGRSAFDGLTVGAEMAFRTGSQLDVALGVDYADKSSPSSYRNFVDNNNQEIRQTTRYQRVPVTLAARWYPAPRGRSVGSLAWIPSRISPWLGAGGGALWYRFVQEGDFASGAGAQVFPDRFEASGWRPAAVGMAGFDVTMSPRVALRADARYLWASSETLNTRDYSGYTVDPSGVSATLGLTFRL